MAKIVVIEDSRDIAELLRVNLELAGHCVVLAADGTHGLSAVVDERPDLVLLDVLLPGIDGFEVLARLKTAPVREIAEIPVILLTAKVDDIDRIRGGIEGAIRYVTKPFSVAELRSTVSQALDGGSEPARRDEARRGAMVQLARLEASGPSAGATPPRAPDAAPPAEPASLAPDCLAVLPERQLEVVEIVAATATVTEAAARLGVTRTTVYANLRRSARRLGLASATELLHLARSGGLPLG